MLRRSVETRLSRGFAVARRMLALASLTLVHLPAEADTFTYSLAVPDGRKAAFEVSIPVEQDGALVVEASWSGSRILSFRLQGPGDKGTLVRRSGPSPQTLKLEVHGKEGQDRGPWKLAIRALPASGEIRGTVKVRVPGDGPRAEEPPPPAAPPVAPDPPMPEWALPRIAPRHASPPLAGLFERVEAFRAKVTLPGGGFTRDGCVWQTDLLRDLAAWRDALAEGRSPLDPDGREFLASLATGVGAVEELSTARDPIRAGPPPEDSLRKRAWVAVRRQELRPLEAQLDALAERLRQGPVPGLEKRTWPQRLVACLTACERWFDERVFPGEEEAAHQAIAEAQWDAILLAAAALESLVETTTPMP